MTSRSALFVALCVALVACAGQTGAPATIAPTRPPADLAPAVTATTLASPTLAPPAPTPESIWPLAADLYYLTDQGQVYRQPYAGDESAAAPVTPAGVVVTDFALGPGGDWLLYRANGTITALSLATQVEQIVSTDTGSPRDVSRGQTMAWSPDAAKLAYTTHDGFQLMLASDDPASPLAFDIPVQDSFVIDLRWSPDSRWLAAWADSGQAMECDSSDAAKLQCYDLGTVSGLAWLADGRLALLSAAGTLELADPANPDARTLADPQEQLDLAPLLRGAWDAAGQWSAEPVPESGAIMITEFATATSALIAASGAVKHVAWGDSPPQRVSSLPMPATLYFLAYQREITQVWRLAATGQEAEPITAAFADVTAYDISRDGAKVAYTSGGAIFVQTIGASDAQQIALLPPDAHSPTGTPTFSPTGRRVAFANNGIWVYDTVSQSVIRLMPDSPAGAALAQARVYDQPRYSPDGNWLLVRANTAAGVDHAVLPSGGANISVAMLAQVGAQAEWLSDNRVVAYGGLGGYAVSVMQAYRVRSVKTIFDAIALDAQERADGRLALLRASQLLPFGPATFSVFSLGLDGADPQAETLSMLLASPLMSPDAVLIAGLVGAGQRPDGTLAGQLAILNPATQQTFVIEGIMDAHGLMWGR